MSFFQLKSQKNHERVTLLLLFQYNNNSIYIIFVGWSLHHLSKLIEWIYCASNSQSELFLLYCPRTLLLILSDYKALHHFPLPRNATDTLISCLNDLPESLTVLSWGLKRHYPVLTIIQLLSLFVWLFTITIYQLFSYCYDDCLTIPMLLVSVPTTPHNPYMNTNFHTFFYFSLLYVSSPTQKYPTSSCNCWLCIFRLFHSYWSFGLIENPFRILIK